MGIPWIKRAKPGGIIRANEFNALVEQATVRSRLRCNGADVSSTNGGQNVGKAERLPPFAVALVTSRSTNGPALPSTIVYGYNVVWPRGYEGERKSAAPAAQNDEVEVWPAPLRSPALVFTFTETGGEPLSRLVPFGEAPAWEECAASAADAQAAEELSDLRRRVESLETLVATLAAP